MAAKRVAAIPTLGVVTFVLVTAASAEPAAWPQWGGPDRNFRLGPAELSSDWSEDGPRELWRRPLGDGYSAIAVAGDRLFTMYRRDNQDVTVALDRATGETLWEQSWEGPIWKDFLEEYGFGPRVTPLVEGDSVFTVGITGRLVCLNAATGEVRWQRDLWEGYDVDPAKYGPSQLGYSSSPLFHDGSLIVVAGGPGKAVMALEPEDGSVRWEAHDFEPSFASPILIEVGDQEQLVVFAANRVVGLNPANGVMLWEWRHETPYNVNASTPVWDGESLLFVSSAYDSGGRALCLTREGDKTKIEEIWSSREIEIHHQTAILLDRVLYASSGDFGPAFLTATNLDTGEQLFRQRGFAKANFLAVGDQLVILDEDGALALARLAGEGLEILAEAQVFNARSWTVPSLVETTLYARDRREIAAFDLSAHE